MPREANITYEQVAAVADAIKAEGGRPQWRAVRERLGTGSGGTIHRMLQQWQAGQVRQIESTLVLPPALQRSILDFMAQEVAGAKASLEADLAESQQSAADLALENERQLTQIEAQQADIEALQGERSSLEGRLEQMEADLAAAREEASRERQAAEAARTELAKAVLRLEAMPRLESDLAEVRNQYQQADLRRQEAERELAVARAERQASEHARQEAEARIAEVIKRAAESAASLEQARQRIAELEGDAKAAKANASALEAQIADRQRLEAELATARKEATQAAAQLGKMEGRVEALQRQVAEQADIMRGIVGPKQK